LQNDGESVFRQPCSEGAFEHVVRADEVAIPALAKVWKELFSRDVVGPQHVQQRAAKFVIGVDAGGVFDVVKAFEEPGQTRYRPIGIRFERCPGGQLSHNRAPRVVVGEVEQRSGKL